MLKVLIATSKKLLVMSKELLGDEDSKDKFKEDVRLNVSRIMEAMEKLAGKKACSGPHEVSQNRCCILL
ncbi:hypothetical protein ACFLY6_00665 [Candidatus Dependentiae bacterium]